MDNLFRFRHLYFSFVLSLIITNLGFAASSEENLLEAAGGSCSLVDPAEVDLIFEETSPFDREEPHLSSKVSFQLKQNNSGILENIPSLEEFKTMVLSDDNFFNSFNVLYSFLHDHSSQNRTPSYPYNPEYIYNGEDETLHYKTIFIGRGEDPRLTKDLDMLGLSPLYEKSSIQVGLILPRSCDVTAEIQASDLFRSALLIFYVKTYIHPRWIISTKPVKNNNGLIKISVNTWNSYRPDLRHEQTGYAAICRLLREGILYESLLQDDTVHIFIDSNGTKQRFCVNLENKTGVFPKELARNGEPVEPWDSDSAPERTKDGSGIIIPTERDLERFLGPEKHMPLDEIIRKMSPERRPVCFFGPFDFTVTQNGEIFLNSSVNMLRNLNENSDPKLYDAWAQKNHMNGYKDFLCTSLVTVAQPTQFINTASRSSGGQFSELSDHPCHLLFAAGFRGELPHTPEYDHMVDVVSTDALGVEEHRLNQERYLQRFGILFSSHRRYIEGTDVGGREKTVAISGLGLGVWKLAGSHQKALLLRSIAESYNQSGINVRFMFDTPKNDLLLTDRGWERVKRKEPGQLVKENSDEHHFFVFAGDSNSYRGNEGLVGWNCMSGDPQYFVNSLIRGDWNTDVLWFGI